MSSPLSNLQKGKKAPLSPGSRVAPYKRNISEDDFVNHLLANSYSDSAEKLPLRGNNTPSNNELLSSMMNRLTMAKKKLQVNENTIREKDKKIKVLEEKCEIYRKAQGYGNDQVVELEKKCHQLQRHIHAMEEFLEDYGMIWVGQDDESEEEYEELNDGVDSSPLAQANTMWSPGMSVTESKTFAMDFDLVLKNVKDLNQIAGEGEHFIKHTKEGARLQVKEPVPLTLYQNGIFMFGGPFRPYEDELTQICMSDIMDGYFPIELQTLYPDGVPFKVEDKRYTVFKNKRHEQLFPGQGHALSPEKQHSAEQKDRNVPQAIHMMKTESELPGHRQTVENFLSKLPTSVIQRGKIIDIRDSLKQALQDQPGKNDVIVVQTEVVDEMKQRISNGQRSRPQTASSVTTLRIKSETGDQIYLLKMKYTHTIQDVRNYLDEFRKPESKAYELKTSFPNQTYDDLKRSLKDYDLVPNATMYVVVKNKTCFQ